MNQLALGEAMLDTYPFQTPENGGVARDIKASLRF